MFEEGVDEASAVALARLGYPRELCERALVACAHSVAQATLWLKANDEGSPLLFQPSVEKTTAVGAVGACRYATSAMQGCRRYMEDVVRVVTPFLDSAELGVFLVCDGHGSAAVATFVADELPDAIATAAVTTAAAPGKATVLFDAKHADAVLASGYKVIDDFLGLNPSAVDAGSTSLTLLLSPSHLVVANVGDTRFF